MGSPEHISRVLTLTIHMYLGAVKYSLPFMSRAHIHDDRMSATCAHYVHMSPHNTVRAIEGLPEHVMKRYGDLQPKPILGLQAGLVVTKGSRTPKLSILPHALHSMDKHRAAFAAANKEGSVVGCTDQHGQESLDQAVARRICPSS
jgi:hypothetical protein